MLIVKTDQGEGYVSDGALLDGLATASQHHIS